MNFELYYLFRNQYLAVGNGHTGFYCISKADEKQITPENKGIHRFRKKQFNNFVQIAMPYLASFVDPEQYEMTLVDEYNQKIPFNERFDLVAITVNTSNASHWILCQLSFGKKERKWSLEAPCDTSAGGSNGAL
ncbi:hypothetical protein [Bacillus sp. EB600]|uniref:hypothetical protein n=1 Tax=Bacillus sp. EB600 TaxID=2806345 RepID=UPI00210A9529|nr:hypothetical protein [Bacillus sp. EB600]MCQ6282767.1 hypothetical protein [Bacillus sp. EB600]